ncbi:MAG: NUDIX domain-containing protein [Elainellaceae cyanobacterium]
MRPTISQTDVPHIVEDGTEDETRGDRPSRHIPTQLSDSDYAAALDNLVLTCVDVVLVHQQSVLLVKRDRLPRKSWWILGGRMIPGESPRQAAQRKATI